jgi:hypothetical protein
MAQKDKSKAVRDVVREALRARDPDMVIEVDKKLGDNYKYNKAQIRILLKLISKNLLHDGFAFTYDLAFIDAARGMTVSRFTAEIDQRTGEVEHGLVDGADA